MEERELQYPPKVDSCKNYQEHDHEIPLRVLHVILLVKFSNSHESVNRIHQGDRMQRPILSGSVIANSVHN